MKKSFMPREDIDAIGNMAEATLKVVVPEMVDETTNDSMKAIKLEREKTKADIAAMVADAVRKEQDHTRNYINNHILHVHPTESASSSIHDLQQQLYIKIKDDEQARGADVPIWLALKFKYEKSAPIVEPCTVEAFRNKDHKYHHDDDARLEEESSTKSHRTSEHGTYTRVEFDAWDNEQGTNNDEVPSKEVSPKLIDEMTWNEIPTADEQKRMQEALNDMMRNQCDSGEEHQYHLDQMKSYMGSQIVWESRK
ncbi:hypothetical protein Tco_0587657 [Tanacetum coccineum]